MNKKNIDINQIMLGATVDRRKFIKKSCLGATGIFGLSKSNILLASDSNSNFIKLEEPANPDDDQSDVLQDKINEVQGTNVKLIIANCKHHIRKKILIHESITIEGEGDNSEFFCDLLLHSNSHGEIGIFIRPEEFSSQVELKPISNIHISNLIISCRKVPERTKRIDGYLPPTPFGTRGVVDSTFTDLKIKGGYHGWDYREHGYNKNSQNKNNNAIFCGKNTIKRITFEDCCLWAFNIRGNKLYDNHRTNISDVIIRNCNVGLVVSNEGHYCPQITTNNTCDITNKSEVEGITFERIMATQCDTPLHLEAASNLVLKDSIFRALGPGDPMWDSCLDGKNNHDLTKEDVRKLDLWPSDITTLPLPDSIKTENLAPFKGHIITAFINHVTFNNCELSPRVVSTKIIGDKIGEQTTSIAYKIRGQIKLWTSPIHKVDNIRFENCHINQTIDMTTPIKKEKWEGYDNKDAYGDIIFDSCNFGEYVGTPIDHSRDADPALTWIQHIQLINCKLYGPIYTNRTHKMTVTDGEWHAAIGRTIKEYITDSTDSEFTKNTDFTQINDFSLKGTALHLTGEFTNGFKVPSAGSLSGGNDLEGTSITFEPNYSASTQSSMKLLIKNYATKTIIADSKLTIEECNNTGCITV